MTISAVSSIGSNRALAMGSLAIAALLVTTPLAACSNEQPAPSPNTTEAPFAPNSVRNILSVTADNRILWNERPVTERQLATLLQATGQLDPEPELEFRPDADAPYELSAKALDLIKASKVTKFGFIGNELYSESEAPAD